MGVILRAHPVRGESHIQRNASSEVATPLSASGQRPLRILAPHVKASPPHFTRPLKWLAITEDGKIAFVGTTIRTATQQQLSAWTRKGCGNLWESFMLAGITLSLLCSAPCGTGQTTIDTGCVPALLRNSVDHPADCNPINIVTQSRL